MVSFGLFEDLGRKGTTSEIVKKRAIKVKKRRSMGTPLLIEGLHLIDAVANDNRISWG